MGTTVVSGVQYSGMWTLDQATNAKAAGTWPVAPDPLQGYLYSWGRNNYGQLGIGSTANKSSPNIVGSLDTWKTLASNYLGSMASIKVDGTLWTWGTNSNGQLGLGNTTAYSSPKQVGSGTNWSQLSGGRQFFAAIKTDGTLWTWGANGNGQLGTGNTTYYSSPKQIGALTSWVSVTCGYANTFAIKTDGTLWSWGRNDYGQLGLGNTTQYSSPKQVGSDTNWALAGSIGTTSSIFLRTDGTLWTCGRNQNGQLGLNISGAYTSKSSPNQVGTLTTWANFKKEAGANFALAVKTDGTLWSWGYNNAYQLGVGNLTDYSSPKQIGALTNWSKVSGWESFSVAIKTDGTLWVWGEGSYGQLGQNNATTQYSSPVQVGAGTTWLSVCAGAGAVIATRN